MLKIPNIKIMEAPGAIWAEAVKSSDIPFQRAQSVSFVLTSGTGTAATVTCKVMAKKGTNGTPAAVDFLCGEIGKATANVDGSKGKALSIGGTSSSKSYIVTITADMLTGTGYDTVYITTTAAANSTVSGAIVAITGQNRYSE